MAAVKSKTVALVYSAIVVAMIDMLIALSRVISIADYSITLLCGLLIGVVVIECGSGWAVASYITGAVLGLIISVNECALLFLVFFGYYPILKPWLEKLPKLAAIPLKLVLFNSVIVLSYALIDALLIPSLLEFDSGTFWPILLLLAAANVVFWLYDVLFGRVMSWYVIKIHPTVRKITKGR